jgi:hypothetical protein
MEQNKFTLTINVTALEHRLLHEFSARRQKGQPNAADVARIIVAATLLDWERFVENLDRRNAYAIAEGLSTEVAFGGWLRAKYKRRKKLATFSSSRGRLYE